MQLPPLLMRLNPWLLGAWLVAAGSLGGDALASGPSHSRKSHADVEPSRGKKARSRNKLAAHKHRRHKRQEPPAMASPEAPASPPSSSVVKLIIPVQGIKRAQLVDTYLAARSGGRVHDAIDILAPRDTPVLAATGGKLLKLFKSQRGGLTVNQLGDDGETIYYYAHLDHYAEGMIEGRYLKQGEVIGYVGDTGNPAPGNYHLHFAIWHIRDVNRYWEGDNVDPYPRLME